MTLGRPPKYTNPQDMQDKIEEFIAYCSKGRQVPVLDKKGFPVLDEKKKVQYWSKPWPLTVSRLALFLGFASEQSLLDYSKKDELVDGDDTFSWVITRAKTEIKDDKLVGALEGTYQPQVSMRDLACNHDMTEKYKIEIDEPDEKTTPKQLANVKAACLLLAQGYDLDELLTLAASKGLATQFPE